MTESAGLARDATTVDASENIEFAKRIGTVQRLAHDQELSIAVKILVIGTCVDYDFTVTRNKPDASHGALTTTGGREGDSTEIDLLLCHDWLPLT